MRLSVHADGAVSGKISIEGSVWRVVDLGPDGATSRLAAIVALDERTLTDGKRVASDVSVPTEADAPSLGALDAETNNVPPGTYRQRLLVLWTDRVEQLDQTDSYDLEQAIFDAVADANAAYAGSDIDEIALELVGAGHLPGFTEYLGASDAGEAQKDLRSVRSNASVRALREQHRADLVMMITAGNYGIGGIANLTTRDSDGNVVPGEFSIVTRNSLLDIGNASPLTFAHEVGHNQGAHHHRDDLDGASGTRPNNKLYNYGYGWRFEDRDYILGINIRDSYYSTVMAYTPTAPNNKPHLRIERFSNPDVRFDSQPTGNSNREDNARVLENTAALVAGFYVDPFTARIQVSSPLAPYPGPYTFTAITGGTEGAQSYEWYLSRFSSNSGSVFARTRSFSGGLSAGAWYVRLVARSTNGTVRTVDRAVVIIPNNTSPPCQQTAGVPVVDGLPICPIEDLAAVSDETTLPAVESGVTELTLRVGPNPISGRGVVTVELPEAAEASVTVHDLLGRQVATLTAGELVAGRSALDLDASAYAPGIYVVRLRADDRVVSTQMTVSR